MDRPEIFLAPGPVAVPPQVYLAQGSPLVYHRGPAFGDLLRDLTTNLQKLFRTKNDVLTFTASGTGGLESAVANLMSPGDRVVIPVAGYFGERLAKISKAYGAEVRTIDYEWGQIARAADVKKALDEAPTKAVLVQQSETSTGAIHDVQEIAAVAKAAGALVVVDCVSSVGAVPFEADAWGIDVAVSGSQKALSATPGVAFASISPAAWEASKTARNPRFYFDWALYKESFDRKNPENPFTPAISVMMGMKAALDLYFQDGAEEQLRQHERRSRAVKEAVRALGLELFGEDPDRNWAVTAIRAPEGIDGDDIVARVRKEHGVVLAPGQGPLKGKVFRIGHLGYYDALDMIRGLAAIEMTLHAMGVPVQRGAAVAAAEAAFARD